MHATIWRIRALDVPVWATSCTRCASPHLVSTGRFRVNANGALHDVWLLYRCPVCDEGRKRRILKRVRADAPGVDLAGFRRDDPALAVAMAFGATPYPPVPYVVEREPLPESGRLMTRIEQPHTCGVRWDRLLAAELGWSRSRIGRAFRCGSIEIEPAAKPSQVVRDGQRVSLDLG